MTLLETFKNKIKANPRVIVYPEGNNPVIIKAAAKLQAEHLVKAVLLGYIDEINASATQMGIDLTGTKIIQPDSAPQLAAFVEAYCTARDMPTRIGQRLISLPLYFGAMMVNQAEADGVVAGIDHSTEEVIMASELIIGLQAGIQMVSSFFLMEIPDYSGGENGLLIFADPAVNPDPNAEQLADIAISTANSAKTLLGWQPRVAMLSFSTRGSASHPLVDKVSQAVSIAREKAPDLLVDGEMQADAALVEAVAVKKMGQGSPVAGKANILIFPDLNAANISCKLVQRLAKASAYGPILQGFRLPVSDLSRGATVDDVVGASIILSAQV
ncbi:MAG: phosphate acetyltransferase [Chloroflexi bacterium HGW-Chloroflexi-10]|nr:MAG: phosphate acetyltransferase [Chloroflexi bacterium HGW-Chloroflexi-10]